MDGPARFSWVNNRAPPSRNEGISSHKEGHSSRNERNRLVHHIRKTPNCVRSIGALSEADIASLLQAKAAIAAGIVCLLDRVGLKGKDVTTLYLAGGFGFHMEPMAPM